MFKNEKSNKSQFLIEEVNEKSTKSQPKVNRSQLKVSESHRIRKKKSKNFSKVNFFRRIPSVFQVTYRGPIGDISGIFGSITCYHTYAINSVLNIRHFLGFLEQFTNEFIIFIISSFCFCAKYAELQRRWSFTFENYRFSLKETTLPHVLSCTRWTSNYHVFRIVLFLLFSSQ